MVYIAVLRKPAIIKPTVRAKEPIACKKLQFGWRGISRFFGVFCETAHWFHRKIVET